MPGLKNRATVALAAVVALAAALAAVLVMGLAPAESAAKKPAKVLPFMTHKCKEITSNGCFWRAKRWSFYAVPVKEKKCVVYWYKPGYRFCIDAAAKVPQDDAAAKAAVAAAQ
jgi:hypothetical protein